MDARQYGAYRRQLVQKQEELLASIARLELDGRVAEEAEALDMGDKANQSYNKESLFQQLDHDRVLLNRVQEALRRGEEKTFGECVECGRSVEAKRLDAVPWTSHCIRCQELQDKGML